MFILIGALLGAVIYRARGMGIGPARPFWQVIFAIPYAAVTLAAVGPSAAVVVLALTVGAVLTGHASYIDLGAAGAAAGNTPADGGTDEWYGKWLPWSGYWHDFAGLAVSGILITAACGLALTFGGHFLSGLAILLSGSLKAPAYAAGHKVHAKVLVDPVLIGEALTGALLWGTLTLLGAAA